MVQAMLLSVVSVAAMTMFAQAQTNETTSLIVKAVKQVLEEQTKPQPDTRPTKEDNRTDKAPVSK